MKINFGDGSTKYGPGVQIDLDGSEVVRAIYSYLAAHDIHIRGSATITVNGDLCKSGGIYVDPSAFVLADGKFYNGNGTHKVEIDSLIIKPTEIK